MATRWFKGRGTSGDFVLLEDHDGTQFNGVASDAVAQICRDIGGPETIGLLRVVRAVAVGHNSPAEWFMDDRRSDGQVRDMCGNGVRIFARHLYDQGLVDGPEFSVQTRDGLKFVWITAEEVTVDMGPWTAAGQCLVTLGKQQWKGIEVNLGDPHAVVLVDDIDELEPLEQLKVDSEQYPDGINVEFVQRIEPGRIRVRAYGRDTGEISSCDTGACAAGVALANRGAVNWSQTLNVEMSAGSVAVRVERDRTYLTGPAEIVGDGTLEESA